jgi:hypothetical protein
MILFKNYKLNIIVKIDNIAMGHAPFVERFDKPLENRMMKCMKLKILIIGLICGSCIRCI